MLIFWYNNKFFYSWKKNSFSDISRVFKTDMYNRTCVYYSSSSRTSDRCVTSGVWRQVCDVRCVTSGLWRQVCDVRCVTSCAWSQVCDVRCVTSGVWRQVWHQVCDVRCVTSANECLNCSVNRFKFYGSFTTFPIFQQTEDFSHPIHRWRHQTTSSLDMINSVSFGAFWRCLLVLGDFNCWPGVGCSPSMWELSKKFSHSAVNISVARKLKRINLKWYRSDQINLNCASVENYYNYEHNFKVNKYTHVYSR